ncbi:MAG TPA: DUF1571 domain-containing protein [Chitinophagales bacterium]|nr:DUF1571 domain-containing protein [Chitinophagales bacterium]
MLRAIDKTYTLSYTFKSYERLKGNKNFYTEMDVKMSVAPFKIYALTKSDPNKGVEVLLVSGQWENKALVNPGNWLPNVKLSPYGERMRENQHHTLYDSGFGLLSGIIRNAIKRADSEKPGQFETLFRYEGDVTWEGRQCYKVTIDDPTFTYVDYTVQPGDDADKIAKRNFICGYLILEKNPAVKDWESLKPGMKIKIPTSYAKKTILYIDKQTYLPIVQTMYDEAGQFEKYEFHNLKVNPVFKDIEFTPDFEGYNF